MKEPWETLLGHMRDHWFLFEYLDEDTPRIRAIKDDERYWGLSHGEQALIDVADAMIRINAAWAAVDDDNQTRIHQALRIALDA